MQTMYYIGLDVHKRKISYCVKDGSGTIQSEGSLPATRFDLDRWRAVDCGDGSHDVYRLGTTII
jgi:predicted NBD/HSP70 family sugar kinase